MVFPFFSSCEIFSSGMQLTCLWQLHALITCGNTTHIPRTQEGWTLEGTALAPFPVGWHLCCYAKTLTTINLRRKGLCDLITSVSQSITEGNQGKSSRWEPGSEHRSHGGELLTGLVTTVSSACFLRQLRTTLFRGGTTQLYLTSSHSLCYIWDLSHLLPESTKAQAAFYARDSPR